MIALDVGGTKADAVLFSDDGEVIARRVDPAGIPFDHGVEKTLKNCKSTIDKLISSANVPVSAFYAAIATVEYYHNDFVCAFEEYFADYIGDIAFLCSDGYEAYSRYCENNAIPHYVRMSEWQKTINK